ncbi:cytochrome d ubiquinol oxidase subunit II [Nakamurella sp. YIM 132087]|uniref:Cytochrome d ubiquinol oxidase subunit II n=1 Tax=Nakamurella alba TaxID=2665158 RepID=A0A7K1FQN7_9ACTN|nr:cytochrome d ubiquinol oxidase subunit II [Nakamurella alba]MTD16461.1 cytochrome d ubiquinol oxidase subunit II [Nakamurella alba]
MWLNELWFVVIAVLWIGFFVLEGFDFGVGALLPVVGRDERGRRVLINTIGPVWDGNEVWLLTAAGATFAAFPDWYATMFSGFYLPMLLLLVCLIVRGVAFEYRGKGSTDTWRARWDVAITGTSWLLAALFGVVFGNLVAGVPIDASGEYVGGLGDLLQPFALLTGLCTLLLFLTHGAVFLALKSAGEVRDRARRAVQQLAPAALVVVLLTVTWQQFQRTSVLALVLGVVAVLGLVAAGLATRRSRDGWAFVSTAVSVLGLVSGWFAALHPAVMPSSLDPAFSLTLTTAASGPYTLEVMSWVSLFLVPFVVGYQAWSYWVFRKRISVKMIPAHTPPAVPAGPPGSR